MCRFDSGWSDVLYGDHSSIGRAVHGIGYSVFSFRLLGISCKDNPISQI